MFKFHNPIRKSNLYDKNLTAPFKLSRSKIDLFIDCPRCFYMDRKLGIGRPSMPGFSLNSAVDALLKNEFDLLRKAGQKHELMKKYNVDALPYMHPDLDKWRNNFIGKQYLHEQTNFLVYGSVDDVWECPNGELIIVDYKSTSTSEEISLESKYKQGYKRQMEIYQWIFKMSGFKVCDTGYFVFANAGKNRDKFDGRLEFELTLLSHKGDYSWVGDTLLKIKECLDSDVCPECTPDCEYCRYTEAVNKI